MRAINPWINFNGNAQEAFNFYKSVFGGEFTKIIRFKDLAGPEFQVAESEENKIVVIVYTRERHLWIIDEKRKNGECSRQADGWRCACMPLPLKADAERTTRWWGLGMAPRLRLLVQK